MIVETIDISLRTGEIQIPTTETIRPKDESQIVTIDKIHRAIGMIEIALHTKGDRMIETPLHIGGIQATIATALRTGGMTTVIITTVQTIVTAKIDDTIVIHVMNRIDDITHRMINEALPRTEGTTTIIPIRNDARVHIRT